MAAEATRLSLFEDKNISGRTSYQTAATRSKLKRNHKFTSSPSRPIPIYATIIHSFIQKFVKHPFKKSTQRRPPSPVTTIQISLKQPAEHTLIIFRQEVNFQGDSIPGRGTNNGECSY